MLKLKVLPQSLILVFGLALATISTAQPAKATTFTYQGDTTNQPIWRRTAPGNPPTLISGERDGNLGMSVPYSVFDFTVDQTGLYTITGVSQLTPPATTNWDIFLVLYQDSFDPNKQLTNVLIASTTTTASPVTFNRQLTSGRKYVLVTTGRQVDDFGIFTNTISGSGRVMPIPEPDLIPASLLACGVGLLSYRNKRNIFYSFVCK